MNTSSKETIGSMIGAVIRQVCATYRIDHERIAIRGDHENAIGLRVYLRADDLDPASRSIVVNQSRKLLRELHPSLAAFVLIEHDPATEPATEPK